jgi:hypothetical protein
LERLGERDFKEWQRRSCITLSDQIAPLLMAASSSINSILQLTLPNSPQRESQIREFKEIARKRIDDAERQTFQLRRSDLLEDRVYGAWYLALVTEAVTFSLEDPTLLPDFKARDILYRACLGR